MIIWGRESGWSGVCIYKVSLLWSSFGVSLVDSRGFFRHCHRTITALVIEDARSPNTMLRPLVSNTSCSPLTFKLPTCGCRPSPLSPPRWTQDGPIWRQDRPSWRQDGPNWRQDRPSWYQDGPKIGQVGVKIGQTGAKLAPRWTKLAPRWAMLAPRWTKLAPRWAKLAPRKTSIKKTM